MLFVICRDNCYKLLGKVYVADFDAKNGLPPNSGNGNENPNSGPGNNSGNDNNGNNNGNVAPETNSPPAEGWQAEPDGVVEEKPKNPNAGSGNNSGNGNNDNTR